jgi:hypothetical protein
VWAPSPHDVYTVSDARLVHWSAAGREKGVVLDLSGEPGAPPLGPTAPGAAAPVGGGRVQVGTCCVAHGLALAGGFNGELVVKPLVTGGNGFYSRFSPASMRVTLSDNGITNGIEVVPQPGTGGGLAGDPPGIPSSILVANNDNAVRLFDAATLQRTADWGLDWAANWATACPKAGGTGGGGSPAGGLVAIVGDDPAALLMDARTARPVARLAGHADYSFAAAWHPGGGLLATGNQDATARVWDVRMVGDDGGDGPSSGNRASLYTLAGAMGAIRSLRWSPDGRFLAAAEPADFVRVYDASSGFGRAQEIDLFGEVAGVAFSPAGDRFFVGVADATYSSLLQFDRAAWGGGVTGLHARTAAAGGDEEVEEEGDGGGRRLRGPACAPGVTAGTTACSSRHVWRGAGGGGGGSGGGGEEGGEEMDGD